MPIATGEIEMDTLRNGQKKNRRMDDLNRFNGMYKRGDRKMEGGQELLW